MTGDALIRTTDLRKVYGSRVALSDVDLAVPAGSVYGLVGPNGAGKTTLLGVLAGLRRATSGRIQVGLDRRKVAVLPDTPLFDPWLTAREAVDLARSLVAPQLPAGSVDAALRETGLQDAADRRVGGFSRGMLQRLGLATTVVGEPELLILDEPCSALDPAGRRDVLDLVARLGRRGTVLFSSHILGDVERVCDTVGVLREGRLLYQGSMDGLLTGHVAPAYRIRVRDGADPAGGTDGAGRVVDALRAEPWVSDVSREGGPNDVVVGVRSIDEAERGLVRVLAGTGIRIVSVEPVEADLERVFLELTS
jgi:ABC-2 type transport system ATP-binding protein